MHHAETSLLFVSIGDQSMSRGEGLVNIYLQGRECEEDFEGITGFSGKTEEGLITNRVNREDYRAFIDHKYF